MTQEPTTQTAIMVSPQFAATIPEEPKPSTQVAQLATISVSPQARDQLSCKRLLEGDTLVRARAEAAEALEKMLENAQVLAVFGNDAVESINRLSDRMLRERPPTEVAELQDIMRELPRRFRRIGHKYDPSDPKVLEKYQKAKSKFLGIVQLGRTFIEEFLDDIRGLVEQCDWAEERLTGKQNQLMRNVAYYDERYKLGEEEVLKLIYKIGVMELIRDLAAEKASQIVAGDASLGDRLGEEKARIAELVTLLENRIIAFKGRLWRAWAMAPQIRNMRLIQLGISGRIDQTVGVTIPSMKDTMVIWLSMGDAEQAQLFYQAVDDTSNEVEMRFANAAKVFVPAAANALATPGLDPRVVVAWTESLAAQAEGFIQAIELGEQKRRELEQAFIASKTSMDADTERLNQAQIEHVLAAARKALEEAPLQIARSIPATQV